MFVATISAQSWDVGGSIMDPNAITSMDLFNWSHLTDGVSTARATAMGGAMVSLGGDASSMAINPAGLGMYRQNDITLTPTVGIANASTRDTSPYDGNNSTKFSIANFGIVFKAYEGTGGVVAVNIGFGYSRLADLNYRTSYARGDNSSSIAGAFARQLTNSGYTSANLSAGQNPNFSWWDVDPTYWGATLGYKCGLVDDPDGMWQPDMYGAYPSVDQYVTMSSKGAIGEYDLSLGMNISNKLYLGFTLGMQSLQQRRDTYYTEEYFYAPGNQPAGYMLEGFNYNQSSSVSGSGVNLKVGLTYRPISALRIGVAFHSPTWYSADFRYWGNMVSRVFDNYTNNYITDPDAYTETWIDSGRDSWNFRTPARLLMGASYTFGQRAILSVDYERAWYGNIHTQSTPVGNGAFNGFFKENFKGSNMFRAGVEVKPTSFIALRAGYGYSGSMLKDKDTIFSSPVNYQTQYASGGIGFILSNVFYIDLAYRYTMQKYTTSKLFYAIDQVGTADEYSGDYKTDIARHNIIMTLGFRF